MSASVSASVAILPRAPWLLHWVLAALLTLWASLAAAANPAVALYYGDQLALRDFANFDMVVVDPDHADLAQAPKDSQLYAYVSVTEVHPSRPYSARIPADWKFARNADWQSEVIDQSVPQWPAFFADEVVAPLWQRGYRGFFLDTLDSYRLAKEFDEAAQQAGLVRVIETLHQRFPGIQLIFNRGFDILPQVQGKVQMVAAESLYQGWSAKHQRYQDISESDREWLLGQLRKVQQEQQLPVLVIDYAPVHDRALARETAQRIAQDGFIPWVTDADLSSVGIGSIEPVARRILILHNSNETPSLRYSSAHRYVQMPLNYMGYVVDYADILEPLPTNIHPDRYAGIVTWFSGFFPEDKDQLYGQWLIQRMDEGLPVAVLDNWGKEPGARLSRRLGLEPNAEDPVEPLTTTFLHPMMGLESPVPARQSDLRVLTPEMAAQATPLVELHDASGQQYVGAAITPWGGFVMESNNILEIPGTEQSRWVVDPFTFLQQSLRLPPLPVPDTTTENGRRLLTAHIDGDAYNTRAEFAGSPLTAQILLDQVLRKYRFPHAMSIVEIETAATGMTPELSRQLEALARETFKLPHVEIGSHTSSHPFLWDLNRRHGLFLDDPNAPVNIHVPGYSMDLEREIVGSARYINERLAPPGKRTKLLQWSGDTAPNTEALRITYLAGLLNINGGDTFISSHTPSITAIGALGIRKNGWLQVYAPTSNENIYTNLWTGPFYGFERVLETFAMTDKPRRIKPVGLYYHSYSASKTASLKALHKVYAWIESQPLHPVYTSDFVTKVMDFYDFAIARDGDGWRFNGNGHLRTVRMPASLGQADVAASRNLAGWNPGIDGNYLHLGGSSAWVRTSSSTPAPVPYLFDANARLEQWQQGSDKTELALKGHVPLRFSLANTQSCQVRANQRPLRAKRNASHNTQVFELPDVSARIEILCPGR